MARRSRNLPGPTHNNAQFGNWVGSYSPVPLRGTILSVNPSSGTCVVKTEQGNFAPNVALPNMAQDPDGGGGTLEVPRRGQEVLVQFGISHPFIVQLCPASVDTELDTPEPYSLTETSTQSVLPDNSAASFSGRMPRDGQPGDWARVGNQGQRIAVLDGGVCVIGSSPWSQIYTIATPEKELTRIAGRHMQLYSQFGTMEFGEDGGKPWFKLEGGTDQLSESTLKPANVTFRQLVGGTSPGMFSTHATDREGASIYERINNYDGSEIERMRGGRTVYVGGSLVHDVSQQRTSRVLNGNDTLSVLNGDRIETYQGNQKSKISGRKSATIGADWAMTVGRDMSLTARRHLRLSAGGDPLTAKPGDIAAQLSVANGTFYIETGNPVALDNQAALSGFEVWSMGGGDIKLNALRPPSRIILGSLSPESVVLGGDPITGMAPFHAVKWETLMPILTALATAIDTHEHLILGAIPSGPSITPSLPIVQPLMPLCMSTTVKIGF